MFIKVDKITKRYGAKKIFDDASCIINKGDNVGIIGKNGAGKSTLLKICSKDEEIESGDVIYNTALKVTTLLQSVEYKENITIRQYIKKSILNLGVEEYEIVAILNKFKISDIDQDVQSLSGGQKRRLELALTLVKPSDVLLLDEPTNHLDLGMIKWLEDFLKKSKKTIVVVSHDRYFLDQVATKMFEVDRGKIYEYTGNYSYAISIKKQREADQIATDKKVKSKLKIEDEWMQQGAKARGTKSKERIERFYELKDHENFKEDQSLIVENIASRLGNKTIEAVEVSHNFGDKKILKNFNYNFPKNARIGIVGENGVGKTTVLNILAKKQSPNSGEILIGDTVKIAYFTQHAVELNDDLRIIDYIKNISDAIETKNGILSASKMLERFMFLPEVQYLKIESLSGGEKRRLYLLALLMEKPNVLLLDEPTNDFDIMTLQTLESMLQDFQGIIILVSHDRYFMKKICDTIFELDGTGNVEIFNQGYETYYSLEKKKEKVEVKKQRKKETNMTQLKMSYKEKYDFERIDEDISSLEEKISKIDTELMEVTDYVMINELTQKRQNVEEQLQEKISRWEYLYELNEKIEEQKADKS